MPIGLLNGNVDVVEEDFTTGLPIDKFNSCEDNCRRRKLNLKSASDEYLRISYSNTDIETDL